ncbi:hypothetical protein [Azospirillum oleiclasticum]|nr:hypothetical protein [Azospirillum oleiclasticum]
MVAPAFAQSADSVVGNYSYTGTDTDGSKYSEAGKVVVKKAPSGALEVSWDDGAYVGVGQVTGNVFAVASVADGKNSIMLLTIGADGSLSGPWWRRLDKGAKGTEVWTKK